MHEKPDLIPRNMFHYKFCVILLSQRPIRDLGAVLGPLLATSCLNKKMNVNSSCNL